MADTTSSGYNLCPPSDDCAATKSSCRFIEKGRDDGKKIDVKLSEKDLHIVSVSLYRCVRHYSDLHDA